MLNEFSECNPKGDPYGESKLESEEILKKMETENFIVAIIRPPMVYGKGVKGNMEKLIKFSPILPFKYDKNKRSLVNIDNLLYLTYLVINKQAKGIFISST